MQTIRETIRSWTGDNNNRPPTKASRSNSRPSSKASKGRYQNLQTARDEALERQVRDANAIAWLGGRDHETFRTALKRAEEEISLRRRDARFLCDEISSLFARYINTDSLPEEKQYEVAGLQRDILLGLQHVIRAAETAQIEEIARTKDILDSIYRNVSRTSSTRRSTQSVGDLPASLKYGDEEEDPDKPDPRRRDSSQRQTPPDASASQPTMSFWENDGSTPERPVQQEFRPVDEGIGRTMLDGEIAKFKASPEKMSSSSPESHKRATEAGQEPSWLQPVPAETSRVEGSESTEERTQQWLGKTRQQVFTPETTSRASSHGLPQDARDDLADLMPGRDIHDFSNFHTRGQPAPPQVHRTEQKEHSEFSSIALDTPQESLIQPPPPPVLANPANVRPKEVPGPGVPIPSPAAQAERDSGTFDRPSARRQRRDPTQKPGVVALLPGSTTPEEGSNGSVVSSPEPVYLDSTRLQWYQHMLEAGDDEEYAELRAILPPPEQGTSVHTETMPPLGSRDDQSQGPDSTLEQRSAKDTTLPLKKSAKKVSFTEADTTKPPAAARNDRLGSEDGSHPQSNVATTEARDFALPAASEPEVADSDDPALGPFRAAPSWKLHSPSAYTIPRRSISMGNTAGSSLISISRGFLTRRKDAWMEIFWLMVTSLYVQMLKIFSIVFQVVQNICVRFDIWLDPPFPNIAVSGLSPRSQMVLATDFWFLATLFMLEAHIAVTRERGIWRQANGLTRMYFLDLVREDPPWRLLPRVDTRLMVGWKDVFRLMLGGWLPLHSTRMSKW